MHISIAHTDEERLACFEVLQELRRKLSRDTFLDDVKRLGKEGFTLVRLEDPDVRAVAGFREMELFATGRILYVDDLVTASAHHSKGYGRVLLHWLRQETRRRGLSALELDSGSERADAHRFYRREGLESVALKFVVPV